MTEVLCLQYCENSGTAVLGAGTSGHGCAKLSQIGKTVKGIEGSTGTWLSNDRQTPNCSSPYCFYCVTVVPVVRAHEKSFDREEHLNVFTLT